MKKILSMVSVLSLGVGITTNCVACNNKPIPSPSIVKNFLPSDFISENKIIGDIKNKISVKGTIYNNYLNPLSRIYAIKANEPVYAKITIAAKNSNESPFTYFVNKTKLNMDLIAPILFLYQNWNNEVTVDIYNGAEQKLPSSNKFNIQTKQIYNINNTILNKPEVGNYNLLPNYLFFTSGNSNPKPGQSKQPYLGLDKYGELRWILPQASYDIPLEFYNNDNEILAPINFTDLYPDAHINFYPYVEPQEVEKIDWLGLSQSYYDTSHYFPNHDMYDNGDQQIMIANRYDFKKNNLPPNDAVIASDKKTGEIAQFDMDEAWKNIVYNQTPIWQTYKFAYNDWIHLNALSKIDQNNVIVSSRGLNAVYNYNLQTKSITWLITSSDALDKVIDHSKVNAILVTKLSDLFYGQHGVKYLFSSDNKKQITFLALDNHYNIATIEQYDKNKDPNWKSSFKEITVDLDLKTYTMNYNFGIDNTSFMGEANILKIKDKKYAYVYTPNSGYETFYDLTTSSTNPKILFRKFFSLENYRVTPYLFDDLNINFGV